MEALCQVAAVSCPRGKAVVCSANALQKRGGAGGGGSRASGFVEKCIQLPHQREGDLDVSCCGPTVMRVGCRRGARASGGVFALRTGTGSGGDARGKGAGLALAGVFGGSERSRRSCFSVSCTSSSHGIHESAGEGEPAAASTQGVFVGTDSEGPCVVPEFSDLDRAPTECGSLEEELSLYTGRLLALERFREELAKPEEEISVIRATVLIAQHVYPKTTMEEVEAKFEQMVAEIQPHLPPPEERYPLRMIKAINNYLYGQAGWTGTHDFLDPDNSCINKVLDRRQGLPIMLVLVYIELARRLGLPMQEVNVPTHFMCRPVGEGLEFLVDAHSEGKILFLQDAEEKLSKCFGIPITLNRHVLNLKRSHVSKQSVLTRILFNLKSIYFRRKDPVSTLCIIDYLKLVRPGVSDEVRDYGICLFLLKRFPEAVPCLERYLKTCPHAQDREHVERLVLRMRREI